NFDHGTFVPMLLVDPEATLPTVQLSLDRSLDPVRHIAIGRALAPLRDEGVLILGSGMSYHNMGGFGRPTTLEISKRFDAWLAQVAKSPGKERSVALQSWARAPEGRACHPREE